MGDQELEARGVLGDSGGVEPDVSDEEVLEGDSEEDSEGEADGGGETGGVTAFRDVG